MKNIERRYFATSPDELRYVDNENGEQFIEGYAAKFNVRSKLLYDNNEKEFFLEELQPGSFRKALERDDLDVVALFNHKRDELLGRTTSGTLKVWEDEIGLRYKVSVPNTNLGKDLKELIKRGDITANSFAFSVAPEGQEIRKDEKTGITIRSIKEIFRLSDVSPVINPAYPSTEIAVRSIEEVEKVIEEEEEQENTFSEQDRMKMKLEI